MTSNHDKAKVPFDILGLIFAHYAKGETIRFPLETLLLVCKDWNRAALGHRALWSSFKIYLGHEDTSVMWGARLPQRLTRCGADCLLDIDLRNILDLPNKENAPAETSGDELYVTWTCDPTAEANSECHCFFIARTRVESLLSELSGPDGTFCWRWRTLRLELGHSLWRVGSHLLANVLSYPTPHLKMVYLDHVWLETQTSEKTLLPNTSGVLDLTLLDCELPSLHTFDDVHEAMVGWRDLAGYPVPLRALHGAKRIQTLGIWSDSIARIQLPLQLHQLQTLHIKADHIPAELSTIEFPLLNDLAVCWDFHNPIPTILSCRGIPIENLRRFSIRARLATVAIDSEDQYIAASRSLLALFQRATSLTNLAASAGPLAIILKAMWDAIRNGQYKGLFPSEKGSVERAWITDLEGGDTFELDGEETVESLQALCRRWLPDYDPEILVESLRESYVSLF
ncbi:hypothetical protein M408DRAFT_28047 [Serendipita vermifera MAFF 305830]|uniref:F-box domain-containing protein n=1 Tax=Serendipita vermifera MAFF 305830 TaxID=933852 RepID=A0A0C3AVH4_SERVB|nr:hypothetical protein M408DRAFT_28047 [Serendipita vermifera MAFF 305830]